MIGGEGDTHPSKMRLLVSVAPIRKHLPFLILTFYFRFKNRPNMSFDDAAIEADQEFELHPDNAGTLEYATK